MRGNYLTSGSNGRADMGSPPRARELLFKALFGLVFCGITPACAGITKALHSLISQ